MIKFKFSFLHLIYTTLRKISETMGFNLVIAKKRVKDNYEVVSPSANYAPWISDSLFNKTYDIIKDYTLVDKYRCYELWHLVGESEKLNGALIEVGVWRGGKRCPNL